MTKLPFLLIRLTFITMLQLTRISFYRLFAQKQECLHWEKEESTWHKKTSKWQSLKSWKRKLRKTCHFANSGNKCYGSLLLTCWKWNSVWNYPSKSENLTLFTFSLWELFVSLQCNFYPHYDLDHVDVVMELSLKPSSWWWIPVLHNECFLSFEEDSKCSQTKLVVCAWEEVAIIVVSLKVKGAVRTSSLFLLTSKKSLANGSYLNSH